MDFGKLLGDLDLDRLQEVIGLATVMVGHHSLRARGVAELG